MKRLVFLLIGLTIPALVALALVVGAARIVGSASEAPHTHPTSIIWAHRVFVNRADFARWLRSRGTSYDAWARRHPALAASRRLQSTPKAEQHASATTPRPGNQDRRVELAVALAAALAGATGLVVVVRRSSRLVTTKATRRTRPRGSDRFGIPASRVRMPAVSSAIVGDAAGGLRHGVRERMRRRGPGIPQVIGERVSSLRMSRVKTSVRVPAAVGVHRNVHAFGGSVALAAVRGTWAMRGWRARHGAALWYVVAAVVAAAVGYLLPRALG